jgi:hypothetical protein
MSAARKPATIGLWNFFIVNIVVSLRVRRISRSVRAGTDAMSNGGAIANFAREKRRKRAIRGGSTRDGERGTERDRSACCRMRPRASKWSLSPTPEMSRVEV